MQIAALSTEYVYTDVTSSNTGLSGDPSQGGVAFTFITDLSASPDDTAIWTAGLWIANGGPALWTASVLVGPTGAVTDLVLGTTYAVWVKLTDAPEVPIIKAGTLTVI
jgi:hypothetical protein